jgi:hypothetical protein
MGAKVREVCGLLSWLSVAGKDGNQLKSGIVIS